MNVFIIEDELPGVERLEKLLYEIDPSIFIMGKADSIKSSTNWLLANQQPDLIFMDIELADGQSFEIFRRMNVKSPVIFTTSYDEFALQAFKVNSIDYLLKPIKKEELKKGIEKFKQLQQQYTAPFNIEMLVAELRQQQPKTYRSRFLVKQGQRFVTIEMTDIAYFFVDGRVVFFRTWDKGKYIVDYSLDELSGMLDPQQFNRINRSFITHIKSIADMQNHFNGKLSITLNPTSNKDVIISREYAAEFKKWLGK